jgi:hypothetical protein
MAYGILAAFKIENGAPTLSHDLDFNGALTIW